MGHTSSPTGHGSTPPRRRVALVGSAPLARDMSLLIDSCDIVIRCNEAKTLGGHAGSRTDVLCVTNTGSPAQRIIAEQSIRRSPRFPGLSEVWFPRESHVHLRALEASGFQISSSEFEDRSQDILTANGLGDDIAVTYFSADFNERIFASLKQKSADPFVCPSTGFMALCHLLERDDYETFDKLILGFTFQMWEGHPARAEQRFIRALCSRRPDLHWIPCRPRRWSIDWMNRFRRFRPRQPA